MSIVMNRYLHLQGTYISLMWDYTHLPCLANLFLPDYVLDRDKEGDPGRRKALWFYSEGF